MIADYKFDFSDASEDQLESLVDSSNRLLEAGNETQQLAARVRLEAIEAERLQRRMDLDRRLSACRMI